MGVVFCGVDFMNKQMKFGIFGILFIVCMTGAAQAGFVGSAAELDLESVSFDTINGDATLRLNNEFNQVLVNADGEPAEASGSSDAFSAIGSFGGIAVAGSSPSEFFAATEVDEEGNAGAFASHTIDYMAQGNGEVKVTVDYSLLIESRGVSNQDSDLYASASLFDTGTEEFDEVELEVSGVDDLSLNVQDVPDAPDVLEVLLDVADGDVGTLQFNASSFANLVSVELSGSGVSEVPLPPALVLFVSALVGLTAVGRRQIS